MKFKVGDKVRVKSKEWYEKNQIYGRIDDNNCAWGFVSTMSELCNRILTIKVVNDNSYTVEENKSIWYDFMLEDEPITDISMWRTAEDTQQNMQQVLDSMKDLLIYKNTKYGNSALDPMDVFTRHLSDNNSAGLNSILVRLDDKLKRIQNAEELRKNDVSDLIGYLTLLCVDQEWTDFSEFKD